jgi:hypothetical protein
MKQERQELHALRKENQKIRWILQQDKTHSQARFQGSDLKEMCD